MKNWLISSKTVGSLLNTVITVSKNIWYSSQALLFSQWKFSNPLTSGMNILLIGSGGREHTLAWKMTQSPLCDKLFIAPGNAGTARHGTNLSIIPTDFEKLHKAIVDHNILMLVVGRKNHFGQWYCGLFFAAAKKRKTSLSSALHRQRPNWKAVKSFAKAFMQRHGIPTAAYREFTEENFTEGSAYVQATQTAGCIKGRWSAAGKVYWSASTTHLEALAEFELMILRFQIRGGKKGGGGGIFTGIENERLCTDRWRELYIMLPEAKDYKRVGEGDTGLNRRHGRRKPLPFFDETLRQKWSHASLNQRLGYTKWGMDYLGFIFFGLIVCNGEPLVIEYKPPHGRSETEVVIPACKTTWWNFLSLLPASPGRYGRIHRSSCSRHRCSRQRRLPGEYKRAADQRPRSGSAGRVYDFPGRNKGRSWNDPHQRGRVLAVTAFGEDIREASEPSQYMIEQLHFDDMYYRSDIGFEFRGQ